jgi:hypothetical protein
MVFASLSDPKMMILVGESHAPAIPIEVVTEQPVNTSHDSILVWSMRNFKPRGLVVDDEDGCFLSSQGQKYRFFEGKVMISCLQQRH